MTVGLSPTASGATPVLTLTLPPLDIDLLGVEVKTAEPITVTVSAVEGNGNLLGNVLTAVSSLLNTQGIGAALNNVLGSVVGLLNGLDLSGRRRGQRRSSTPRRPRSRRSPTCSSPRSGSTCSARWWRPARST